MQQLLVVPDAVGFGTIELGDKRYGLLRLVGCVDGQEEPVEIDVALSFADLGQVSAQAARLRSEEVRRCR